MATLYHCLYGKIYHDIKINKYLSTIDVLDSGFSEDEENELVVFEGSDELRLVQPFRIVLMSPQGMSAESPAFRKCTLMKVFRRNAIRLRIPNLPVNGRIQSGKVCGCTDIVLTGHCHQSGDIRIRIVRTFGHTVDRLQNGADVVQL